MIVRYLSGVYSPDVLQAITVSVSKYELDDNLLLLFNSQLRKGEEIFDLDTFKLMGSRFKNLAILNIFQNVLLLLAGVVAVVNMVSAITGGPVRNVFQVVMLFVSIGFTVFAGFRIKSSLEKRLYGGIYAKGIEIYFQTEEEKDSLCRYLADKKIENTKT